jgi:hypothetical protein
LSARDPEWKKMDPGKTSNSAVTTILRAVEEGRQQFHREMASIMPDVKLGEKNSRLTEDELNMFITHAYRKVSQAFFSVFRIRIH